MGHKPRQLMIGALGFARWHNAQRVCPSVRVFIQQRTMGSAASCDICYQMAWSVIDHMQVRSRTVMVHKNEGHANCCSVGFALHRGVAVELHTLLHLAYKASFIFTLCWHTV